MLRHLLQQGLGEVQRLPPYESTVQHQQSLRRDSCIVALSRDGVRIGKVEGLAPHFQFDV